MHLYITDTGMSLQTRNAYRQQSKGTKSGINWNSMFAFGNGTLYMEQHQVRGDLILYNTGKYNIVQHAKHDAVLAKPTPKSDHQTGVLVIRHTSPSARLAIFLINIQTSVTRTWTDPYCKKASAYINVQVHVHNRNAWCHSKSQKYTVISRHEHEVRTRLMLWYSLQNFVNDLD